MNFVNISSRNI